MCKRCSVEILKDGILEIWKFEPCKRKRIVQVKILKRLILLLNIKTCGPDFSSSERN
jgi:hypothetical protein